jgi:FkbM family methyltransferase
VCARCVASLRSTSIRRYADRSRDAFLVINSNDSGGTRIDKTDSEAAADRITIPCRHLTDILSAAGIGAIDALKIDVEGAEDIALGPFLRDTPDPCCRP